MANALIFFLIILNCAKHGLDAASVEELEEAKNLS
jgi:hypothetical protein